MWQRRLDLGQSHKLMVDKRFAVSAERKWVVHVYGNLKWLAWICLPDNADSKEGNFRNISRRM